MNKNTCRNHLSLLLVDQSTHESGDDQSFEVCLRRKDIEAPGTVAIFRKLLKPLSFNSLQYTVLS